MAARKPAASAEKSPFNRPRHPTGERARDMTSIFVTGTPLIVITMRYTTCTVSGLSFT